MQPAADGLERALKDVAIHSFQVGVVTNAEADVNLNTERVKPLLIEQAVRPVRWEESVKKLVALGCQRMLEVGPGKVLRGLAKRIAPSMALENFEAPADLPRIVSAWNP
jgi:[acyl-carrier-protein] S-malonyltransferase